MEERLAQIQACMYQYSRAIYRSIKDLIDPYVDQETQLEYRRAVLVACEQTMERLAKDPRYFAHPDKTLFQDFFSHDIHPEQGKPGAWPQSSPPCPPRR